MVALFQGYDDEADIVDALEVHGLIGISGGRLEVRKKLRKVRSLIEERGLGDYWAHSTINHPDTELGYGYDEDRFSLEEARRLVVAAYDSQLE